MRHAKSDWNTDAKSDFERPLNKRGEKDAPIMGRWLKENGLVPEIIVSSPALRAKQTTLCVADCIDFSVNSIIWEDSIYNASMSDLLDVIIDYSHKAEIMLMTGHCPGMDYLVEYLSRERPLYTASGKLMTTAAVAVLGFGKEGISTNESSAQLKNLIRPADLK